MSIGENYYHGGLLRFDLSPKPSYYKIKELIGKRWHTEADLVTDENGCADFRGFFGDYDIEITLNGKTEKKEFTLSKKTDGEITISL